MKRPMSKRQVLAAMKRYGSCSAATAWVQSCPAHWTVDDLWAACPDAGWMLSWAVYCRIEGSDSSTAERGRWYADLIERSGAVTPDEVRAEWQRVRGAA